MFSITKGLKRESGNVYEATRKYWAKIDDWGKNREMYAVGLNRGVSEGAFKIASWNTIEYEGQERWEFQKEDEECAELVNKDWEKIIGKASGFWKHGGWLAVEFDGKGSFQLFRGGGSKNECWFSCV